MKPDTPQPVEVHPTDDDLLNLAHELLEPGAARGLLDHLRTCAPCETRFRVAAQDRDFWLGRRPDAVPAAPAHPVVRGGAPGRMATLHSFPRWATPVAAAAALALVVLAPSLRHNPARHADAGWLPVTHEHTLLRTPALENAGAGLDRALGVYRSGDAAEALRELTALTIPPEAVFESSLRQLYLASALVLNARPEDALRTLDGLDVPTLPEPWKRWARWTRYLAARDAHHDQAAQALLAELATASNDVGAQARAEQARLGAHGPATVR